MSWLTAPGRLMLGLLLFYMVGSLLIFGYLGLQLSDMARRQIDQSLRSQENLFILQQGDAGLSGLRRSIEDELAADGRADLGYRVLDGAGRTLFEDGDLRLPPGLKPRGAIQALSVLSPQGTPLDARVLDFRLGGMTVFAARSSLDAQALKDSFFRLFVRVEGLVVLLGVTMSILVAHRFHARIEAFNRLARKIVKSGDLSSRMPVQGADEFATLALNVNAMLDRIDRLMQGVRQVSDNIAHDLRSPLTRLRADVEVALQQDDPATARATLERVLDELSGMQMTFNSLLSLGQAEAGGMRIKRTMLDLSAFLAEMVELYAYSAEERGLALESNLEEGLTIGADRQLMAQVLSNLFDNALKYVPAGGRVRLSAARRLHSVELVLEDNGPGIPPGMREKIFDRFTRVDPSRTLSGTGLGLALVRAFVELHGGSVTVADSALGGAAFVIVLPAPHLAGA
ncbi:MAG: ATP-binding protein [Betaproteobacteria bacterium]|nr:ATP-binding protein [Betaproteobacteria bacterium]